MNSNSKKYLGIGIAGIIFSLMILIPVWGQPYVTLSAPSSVKVNQQWNTLISLYIPPDYPLYVNVTNPSELCLITNNNQTVCTTSFSVIQNNCNLGYGYGYYYCGYGYGYGYSSSSNNYLEYNATFKLSSAGTYTFTELEVYSGNKSEIFNLQSPFTLTVSSTSTTSPVIIGGGVIITTSTSTTVNTTNVQKTLQQLGIENTINNTISVQNIKSVSVVVNKTTTIVNTNPNVETEVKNNIEVIVQQALKVPAQVLLTPVKVEQTVNVVQIITKNNTVLTYTVIKQNVNNNVVVEYIPKSLAYNANDITWVKGNVLQVLNPEPVVEVQPTNGTIEYMVPGNNTNATNNIGVYSFSIQYPVNNVTTTNTTTVTNKTNTTTTNKITTTNVTTNMTNTTTPAPTSVSTPSYEEYIIIGIIVIIIILAGLLYYYKKKGRKVKEEHKEEKTEEETKETKEEESKKKHKKEKKKLKEEHKEKESKEDKKEKKEEKTEENKEESDKKEDNKDKEKSEKEDKKEESK